MSNNTTQQMNQTKETNSKESKIKNLCEDGNFHEHDEKSYEKMIQHQNKK